MAKPGNLPRKNTSFIGIGRAIAEAGLAGKVHAVGIDDIDPLLKLIRQGVSPPSPSAWPSPCPSTIRPRTKNRSR